MTERTYDWIQKNIPISYPHLSDEEMAGKVRMLMRDDFDHEPVVEGARDRIMCLRKELDEAQSQNARLREALQKIAETTDLIDSENKEYQAVIHDEDEMAEIARQALGEPND